MTKWEILFTILVTCLFVLEIGLGMGYILDSIVCKWLFVGLLVLIVIVELVVIYWGIRKLKISNATYADLITIIDVVIIIAVIVIILLKE